MIDDPNTLYGLTSWIGKDGRIKPEYIPEGYHDGMKILLIKDN